MKVRMKITISGLRDGAPWPGAGQLMEVSEAEAAQLIAAGQAAVVEPNPEPKPEPAKPEPKPAAPKAKPAPAKTAPTKPKAAPAKPARK